MCGYGDSPARTIHQVATPGSDFVLRQSVLHRSFASVVFPLIGGQVEMQISNALIAWAVRREPVVGEVLFLDYFSRHLKGIDQILVVTVRKFSNVLYVSLRDH
jgi:hypothetical protein